MNTVNISFTDVIELTLVDAFKKKKTALIAFNSKEDWRNVDGSSDEIDVQSMFAGTIMQLFEKDTMAYAYSATAFKIVDNALRKSISFTPKVKIDDEFKDCFISPDGRVIIID